MAMNFKVFDNSQLVAEYAADIIRKQFNNNPTTIAGFHLDTDQAPVLDELKKNVEKHAVDFSQINILDYDDKKSYFEALGVPAGQVYPIAYEKDAIELIADKIKTKENKGKLTLQVVSIDEQGKLNVSIRQGLMEAREIFLVVVEKLYQENGKTSFEPADLKAHRMVNVILDKEAAAGLPEDVKAYFTSPLLN